LEKAENRNAIGRKHRKAGTQAAEPLVMTCVTTQMAVLDHGRQDVEAMLAQWEVAKGYAGTMAQFP
jgi:hypothetical protein